MDLLYTSVYLSIQRMKSTRWKFSFKAVISLQRSMKSSFPYQNYKRKSKYIQKENPWEDEMTITIVRETYLPCLRWFFLITRQRFFQGLHQVSLVTEEYSSRVSYELRGRNWTLMIMNWANCDFNCIKFSVISRLGIGCLKWSFSDDTKLFPSDILTAWTIPREICHLFVNR